MGDDERDAMSYKDKKKLQQKADAQKSDNWNSLFIRTYGPSSASRCLILLLRSDTVAEAMADRLGGATHRLVEVGPHVMSFRVCSEQGGHLGSRPSGHCGYVVLPFAPPACSCGRRWYLLAETHLLKETKDFLKENGVQLTAFEGRRVNSPQFEWSTAVFLFLCHCVIGTG